MSFFRTVARDSLSLAPGIAAQLIGGFVFSLLLGKLLSPEAFGRYSLFFLGQAYASALIFGWFQNAIIRFVPAGDSFASAFQAFGWRFFACIFLISVLAWGVVLRFGQYGINDTILFGLTLLLFVCTSAFSAMQCFFRASFLNLRFSWHAFLLATLKIVLISTIILVATKSRHDSLMMVFGGLILAHLSVLLWQLSSYSRLRNNSGKKTVALDLPLLKRGFGYGFPLSISLFLISLLQSSDRYLLAGMVPLAEMGVYAFWMGVGLQLGRGVYGVLFTALNPRLFQAHAISPDESSQRLIILAWGYSLLFAPICVLAGLYLPKAIVVFGISHGFVKGGWIAVFGLSSAFLMGFSQILGKRSELDERTWLFVAAAAVGVLAMAGSIMVAVPRIGLLGACMGNMAGFLAYGLVLGLVARSLHLFIPAIAGWSVSAVLGWLAVVLEDINVFASLAITVLLYLIVVVLSIKFLKRMKKENVRFACR